MSELMWKIADGAQYTDFIIQQDLRFQEAMRQELHRMANDRGLRLVPKHPPKPEPEPEPKPKAPAPKRKAVYGIGLPHAHWKTILKEVSEKHSVKIAVIQSRERGTRNSNARHEAAWRMRNETKLSLAQIGERLGGRDHTTALHSIRKHQKRIDDGEVT